MSYLDRAKALQDNLVTIRRDLHQHPELGFQEVRTAQRVADTLRDLGVEFETGVAQTGVVAYLGKGKPCIALRADMDALPIQEATGLPYQSENPGVMHACGHDAHTACLLGAAMILNEDFNQGKLKGSVKLLFQPAEENPRPERHSGGLRMVEEGALKDVDAAFAVHVMSMMPTNQIFIRPGPFLTAVDSFEGDVIGRGGHGAYPEQVLDPIWLAAQVISGIHGIVSRRIKPIKAGVISVCTIRGGTATNIIPESVTLTGTIRSYEEDVRSRLHADLENAFAITRAWGGDYKLKIIPGYPPTVNDVEMNEFVRRMATDLIGAEQVKEGEPQMAADDFAYMARTVPAAFCLLGAKKDDVERPHHNPVFDIDEDVMPTATALLAEAARRYLSERA